MKYLLDTDHLSILQRQAGEDFSNLSTRMVQYPPFLGLIKLQKNPHQLN